jgi:hypothetical protein
MSRSSKKLPGDPDQLGADIGLLSEEPEESTAKRSLISQYLAEIGRKGGLKGGKVRAEKLPAKKRAAIARKAANIRWMKRDKYDGRKI